MMQIRPLPRLLLVVLAALGMLVPSISVAQPIPVRDFAPANIGQAMARANMRNISQLPPVTNLGFSYTFDPEVQAYVAQRDDLGSGMLVAPRFNKQGRVSLMLSFAYYKLDHFNGSDSTSVVVDVPVDRFNPTGDRINVGLASDAEAEVAIWRLSARYAILDRLDVGVAVPLVRTRVDSRFVAQVLGPNEISTFLSEGVDAPDIGGNTFFDAPLNNLDLPGGFQEGTNFDVGNVVLDSKAGFDSGIKNLDLGVQGVLRLPSANEDRFSGWNSTSLAGLVLATYRLANLGFYFNGGYEHDFSVGSLSNVRLAGSMTMKPAKPIILEVGVRANLYDKEIDLFDSDQFGVVLPSAHVVAGGSKSGKKEVTVGGGVRFNPFADLSVSAYILAPATNDGYRADAIFALSVDYPI